MEITIGYLCMYFKKATELVEINVGKAFVQVSKVILISVLLAMSKRDSQSEGFSNLCQQYKHLHRYDS